MPSLPIPPAQGPTPPKDAPMGHIWYNTTNGNFYYKSEHNKWVATDHEDHVIDVILEQEEHEIAYDRAMSVL